MTQMEQVTQSSAASAEQAASAGELMSTQAIAMRRVVAELERMIDAGAKTASSFGAPAMDGFESSAEPVGAHSAKGTHSAKESW
jgi:hypothetical protein